MNLSDNIGLYKMGLKGKGQPKSEPLPVRTESAGWDGLSKSKMEFCYCDAIPRKVKKSVIKALEERNTEDAQKMANLLKSIEAKSHPNANHEFREN